MEVPTQAHTEEHMEGPTQAHTEHIEGPTQTHTEEHMEGPMVHTPRRKTSEETNYVIA